VAQASNKRTPQGKSAGGGTKRPAATKAAPGKPDKQPAVARQSVAAARKKDGNNNRNQLIIGGIAIVVIIGIIIVGLVMNKQQNAVPSEGYGPSTQSTATASADGVVTVAKPGSVPVATIDVFEDALCPVCAQFEQQFSQQMNQAIDEGRLAVNYHMLDFLNKSSFSKDYSTRVAAALLCVAQNGGTQPGLFLKFHSALFAPENQPAENGSSDLSNDQLAALATSVGAPDAAATCISSGQNVSAAAASAQTSSATLSQATGGQVGTPTVVQNGKPLKLSVDWLTNLLS
jgi:protein-disulfide isomerase